MRIALLILLLSTNLYAQNYYRFIKKAGSIEVERAATNSFYREIARDVTIQRIEQGRPTYQVTGKFIQPVVPPIYVGGNINYLKGVARSFRGIEHWKRVWSSSGYNGAHHIITKSVLKNLGLNGESIANAPAVFHPLHNNPDFSNYFHDSSRQLLLYRKGGIKLILEDFFSRINKVNKEVGFPNYGEDFIDNEMFEAEVWAKFWGLKWQ